MPKRSVSVVGQLFSPVNIQKLGIGTLAFFGISRITNVGSYLPLIIAIFHSYAFFFPLSLLLLVVLPEVVHGLGEFLVYRVGATFFVSWCALRMLLEGAVLLVNFLITDERRKLPTTTLTRATNAALFRELEAFQ